MTRVAEPMPEPADRERAGGRHAGTSVARLRRVLEVLVAQGIEPGRVKIEMSADQKAAASELSALEAQKELERAVTAAEPPSHRLAGIEILDPGESPARRHEVGAAGESTARECTVFTPRSRGS